MPGKRKRSGTAGKSRKRFKGGQGGFRSKRWGFKGGYPSRAGTAVGPSLALMDGRFNQTDAILIKVKTYLTGFFTSTSGAFSNSVIKMSSLYQPFNNIGSSSHQNPTINNLCTLYQRYRVEWAKITIALTPKDASQPAVPMWAGLAVWDDSFHSVSVANQPQAMEAKHARWTYCPTAAGFNGHAPKLSISGKMSEFFGTSPAEYSTSQQFIGSYNGSSLGDPNQWTQARFMYQSNDGATTATLSGDIILTQYVRMFSRQLYA